VVALLVGIFSFGARRLVDTNRELAEAREELAHMAVVSERLRFARDLHDLLGHSLTLIRVKSELAIRVAATDSQRAVREMTEVEGLAHDALAEVREAVAGYRRPRLTTELANARATLRAAGIVADVDVDPVGVPLEIDEALGWVLREAVTNVVRHSGASCCRVRATLTDHDVRFEVTDDGHGVVGAAFGSGLIGLRERLETVGGCLETGNVSNGGFRVLVSVPKRR